MRRDAERVQIVVEELAAIELGDERLNRRAKRVAHAVAAQPDAGFPQSMATEAELEGLYRLLANDKVTPEKLIAPHFDATLNRLNKHRDVLVVHDNTEFRFPGAGGREGLSKVGPTGCGLQSHFALAMTVDTNEPLGVLGIDSWVRTGESPTQKRKADPKSYAKLRAETSEQDRWFKMVEEVEARVGDVASAIHIMDSEADDYVLLSNLQQRERRFVLRLCYDRRLDAEATGSKTKEKTREFLARAKVVATRDVRLARRNRPIAGGRKNRSAPRDAREATLRISAKRVVFKRPAYCKDFPETLALHVVAVREKAPPPNETPVEWMLLTTEPIDSVESILRVVDAYRARWKIEEYFKALKTGCAIEKRQLESKSTILKAIAIFTPVAWALLRMRHLSRTNPTAPATTVVSALHIKLLREQTQLPLTTQSTVAEAWRAIARLGGHLKQNGPAGWQVIGRGYNNLLLLEAGYKVAKAESAKRSDQ